MSYSEGSSTRNTNYITIRRYFIHSYYVYDVVLLFSSYKITQAKQTNVSYRFNL